MHNRAWVTNGLQRRYIGRTRRINTQDLLHMLGVVALANTASIETAHALKASFVDAVDAGKYVAKAMCSRTRTRVEEAGKLSKKIWKIVQDLLWTT